MDIANLRGNNAGMTGRPDPPPEAELIARAMRRKRLRTATVAARAGISAVWARHIINGAQPLGGGQYKAIRAAADTLAHLAHAVDLTPEQLDQAGRSDAAEQLRDILTHNTPPAEEDPVVGVLQGDEERAIWALPLDVEQRRDYIALHRTRRRGLGQAEPRRAAG